MTQASWPNAPSSATTAAPVPHALINVFMSLHQSVCRVSLARGRQWGRPEGAPEVLDAQPVADDVRVAHLRRPKRVAKRQARNNAGDYRREEPGNKRHRRRAAVLARG